MTFGAAMLCDAVYRDDATNKMVLAGVYTGDIIAQSFPLNIRGALYLEVRVKEAGILDVTFFEDSEPIGGAEAEVNANPSGPSVLVLPLQIEAKLPLVISIRAGAKGEKSTVVMRKVIRAANPGDPIAVAPLPSQSETAPQG